MRTLIDRYTDRADIGAAVNLWMRDNSHSGTAVDPRLFRHVLGHFGTGVTIVTARARGVTYGMTANSFMSGSLKPPLVVVSIGQQTKLHAALASSESMGISILGVDQEHHGRHFSGQSRQPVVPGFTLIDDVPIVNGSLGTIVTHIVARHSCGDHTMFVGEVRHLSYREGSPLLFFKGTYGELSGAGVTSDRAEDQWDLDGQRSWW